jgi:hypothetical protein
MSRSNPSAGSAEIGWVASNPNTRGMGIDHESSAAAPDYIEQ